MSAPGIDNVVKLAEFLPVSPEVMDLAGSFHDTMTQAIARMWRDMEQPIIRIDWPEPIPELGRAERRTIAAWATLTEWRQRPRQAWRVLKRGLPECDHDEWD